LKRASGLVPAGVSVGFLADRGFADTTWMRYLGHEWHGHCRMRVNSNRWIHRAGKGWIPLNQSHLACGDVVRLQGVSLTKTHTLDNLHFCLVMAIATLLLSVQGQPLVAAGKRRWVDAHWQPGNSDLRIGWNWLQGVLHQGWRLFSTLSLSGAADPESN
jgi:hypothetical protein